MAGYGEIALVRGMHYLSESQATVANNLANANTAGFKRRESHSVDAPDRFDAVLGRQLPTPAFREQLAWDTGTLQQTDNRRQIAVEGEFLLQVRTGRDGTAYARGGEFVVPDDIKAVAGQVIAHRLQLSPEAAIDGVTAMDVVASLLDSVPVPRDA